MKRNLIILSNRNDEHSPAMCCMVELEDVLIKDFGAELRSRRNPGVIQGQCTIICVILAFYQLGPLEKQLAQYKQAGHEVIVYAFDSWDIADLLYSRRRNVRDAIFPSNKIENVVDRICVAFRPVVDLVSASHRTLLRHIPLAADTSLANGLNANRPISVLAYGRQLPEITSMIAEVMNDPAGDMIFHHTDHLQVDHIINRRIHRLHFWKMAQSAQIALAYDPKITSPHRATISIIGQRWYESLAAGCVVVGKRPDTEEAEELLDWQDSTIELPADPADALEAICGLLRDPRRISEIRERNVAQVRARHDWRHRIPLMLS